MGKKGEHLRAKRYPPTGGYPCYSVIAGRAGTAHPRYREGRAVDTRRGYASNQPPSLLGNTYNNIHHALRHSYKVPPSVHPLCIAFFASVLMDWIDTPHYTPPPTNVVKPQAERPRR